MASEDVLLDEPLAVIFDRVDACGMVRARNRETLAIRAEGDTRDDVLISANEPSHFFPGQASRRTSPLSLGVPAMLFAP